MDLLSEDLPKEAVPIDIRSQSLSFMTESDKILKAKDVCMSFGGLQAIDSLSFDVQKGQIFSIIGPNGAGKTTAINLIAAIYTPTSGDIYFQDRPIANYKPFQVSQMGIARTFQNIQIFKHMTVRENIMVGHHTRTQSGFLHCLLHTPLVWKEERVIKDATNQLLDFFNLTSKADHLADSLP